MYVIGSNAQNKLLLLTISKICKMPHKMPRQCESGIICVYSPLERNKQSINKFIHSKTFTLPKPQQNQKPIEKI